jgi:hypothetical protein
MAKLVAAASTGAGAEPSRSWKPAVGPLPIWESADFREIPHQDWDHALWV